MAATDPSEILTAQQPKGAAPGKTWAIQARGLTKLYGDFPAVQNVNLDVEPGEFLALLGRNGAGKSTLLKLLSLLTPPSLGELTIGGVDHAGDSSQVRRRLGLLGHNTFLYDELTAEENLLFYARLYGLEQPEAACERALEAAGLVSFRRELVRNFSRGMRQRLAIGRLFLHDPDVLLLDEPFTGLDDRAIALLENALQEARRRNKTVILCAHQLELALKLADRVLILERGKVAYLGPNQPDRLAEMRELYLRFAG
ncbi:MAG: ABC transporter ATP-binding protein [Acidobacteria bacterium]|nr:ABC transporter ATP-binding protein [Acidobacteriota bacterium]